MLRTICRIKHSMISHVSNEDVRQRSAQRPLSDTLLEHQMILFGKVARGEPGDPLRDAVFFPGTLTPLNDRCVRKTGAPRLEWARMLLPHAVRVCGNGQQLQEAVRDAQHWREVVRRYCAAAADAP